MSLIAKLTLIALLVAASVALSRWVPRHPRWRPLVILLNLVVTIRYLWWRGTETLNWEDGWGIAVSLTVYLAELYGFLVVLHHYVIATRASKPEAAPPDESFQPTVDVFIATYNESNDILYRTIVGCQAMTYAAKTIHVLDDGCRPEVEQLCEKLGVRYLGREESAGAKAGNLNHALAQTGADLVVTFDADHVPVDSFLTETVGFFRDEALAQVQTAHHFYNPDLFQDRLRIREYIANEQDMFYHVVQPGRDVYNSSFFCGSGAVFRRTALQDIGGFPTTTITEDLHTSLLLHSRGWRSRYLNRDLSAGLAPESYEAYVTQRRRWARGTLQVMLAQKGLFLGGLSFMQRINYFATLWYWFYGFPRVIYLAAPLFFLLGGIRPLVVENIFDLLFFYLPHLAVSIVAFQLVNQGMRRIFWSDVYESCISIHVAMTAIMFPFSPRQVNFAVTPKGQASSARRGLRLAWPVIAFALLVVAGLVAGITRLATAGGEQDGTLINTLWTAYNLVILGLGLLLLRRRPHRRASVRLPRQRPCVLTWNGTAVEAETTDVSETGLSFRVAAARSLPEYMDVALNRDSGSGLSIRARLVRCDVDRRGQLSAAVDFVERSEDQHRRLVEIMFSDPETWNGPHGITMGAPEHFTRILRSVVAIFSRERRLRRMAPRFRCDLSGRIQSTVDSSLTARIIDISSGGAALRLQRNEPVPSPESFDLTVAWNGVERTTLKVRVRDVRPGASGEKVLGLVFADPTPAQRADLNKHLYGEQEFQLLKGMAS